MVWRTRADRRRSSDLSSGLAAGPSPPRSRSTAASRPRTVRDASAGRALRCVRSVARPASHSGRTPGCGST